MGEIKRCSYCGKPDCSGDLSEPGLHSVEFLVNKVTGSMFKNADRQVKPFGYGEQQPIFEEKEGRAHVEGWIYILKDSQGHYKIGRTKRDNPEERLRDLLQNPTIELIHQYRSPDYIAEELRLHKKYRQYRVKGEWFKLPLVEIGQIINESNSSNNKATQVGYAYGVFLAAGEIGVDEKSVSLSSENKNKDKSEGMSNRTLGWLIIAGIVIGFIVLSPMCYTSKAVYKKSRANNSTQQHYQSTVESNTNKSILSKSD